MRLFQDPALHPFVIESRRGHNPTTGDSMCGKTLATDDTISAWQSFYQAASSPEESAKVWALLKLGSGVNGHIDTCHGGFLAVVLDEVIGTISEYERPPDKSTMTAFLKVDYKRPVPTPGYVLVKSWVEKREGRKIWARGSIEDGEGNILTVGDALFLVIEPLSARPKI
jgi:thioesterase superfamily protein 4